MLRDLQAVIDELVVPPDGPSIVLAMRLRDRLDAEIASALDGFDRAQGWDTDGSASLNAWIRTECRVSNAEAARWVTRVRRTRSWPHTARAWRTGTLSTGQLDLIARNLADRHVEPFAACEEQLVPHIVVLTFGEMLQVLERFKALADATDGTAPPEAEQALFLSQTLDGRWQLNGDLSPAAGQTVAAALRMAERPDDPGEARTPKRRRADAFEDVCRFFLDHQSAKPGGRHRPHVNLIVDADDLAHGRAGGRYADGTPADPIDLSTLACDSVLHRVVIDAAGTILDYGRATRSVPAPLFNTLVIRDHGCRWPGCDRPATWCDGHHVVFWEHGGHTRPDNLVLLCKHHHKRLHRPDWHAKLRPDGELQITDPTGHVRRTHPPGRIDLN